MNIYSLAETINRQANTIVDHLEEELLSVYVFLVNVFSMSDVSENLVFQFVYRSFYQFDQVPLHPRFKQQYFRLMQKYRFENDLLPEEIAKHLYTYSDGMTDPTLTFSYTTKMINMIDANYPIYNHHVSRVFQHTIDPINEPIHKFAYHVDRHKKIIECYEQMLQQKLLNDTLAKFDEKFPLYDLPSMKKLDFIFLTFGKLLIEEKSIV